MLGDMSLRLFFRDFYFHITNIHLRNARTETFTLGILAESKNYFILTVKLVSNGKKISHLGAKYFSMNRQQMKIPHPLSPIIKTFQV